MTLLEWLNENDIQPEDLDDLVHAEASSMASNANNEGVRGQVEFLLSAGLNAEDIKSELI